MTIISNKKVLEIETVGSQDRPINKEDRKAFNDYFKKHKAKKAKKGRASSTQAKKKAATT